MAKKDQQSEQQQHQSLDQRRDFYPYPGALPHGYEQYYPTEFQAQVSQLTIIKNL